MINNFMTFVDLIEQEHYDLVIGDEAWDVDYYYHENPELKRQPFVFLTDFVGCLPMERRRARGATCAPTATPTTSSTSRASRTCATPRSSSAIREDVTEQPFGPGLPGIRDWTDRNFSLQRLRAAVRSGKRSPTPSELRATLGYRRRREARDRRRRRHGRRPPPAAARSRRRFRA